MFVRSILAMIVILGCVSCSGATSVAVNLKTSASVVIVGVIASSEPIAVGSATIAAAVVLSAVSLAVVLSTSGEWSWFSSECGSVRSG